jgi:hypothetical protein
MGNSCAKPQRCQTQSGNVGGIGESFQGGLYRAIARRSRALSLDSEQSRAQKWTTAPAAIACPNR